MKIENVGPSISSAENIQRTSELKTSENQNAKPRNEEISSSQKNLEIKIDDKKIEDFVNILNDVLSYFNEGIRFKIHKETDKIQIQIYDKQSQKVIKEIPPTQILNSIAKMREIVGLIFDIQI